VTVHATVIAKTPEPGRVKTRLCPPCSPEQAATIAEAAILDTFEAIDAVPEIDSFERTLLLAGARRDWMPSHYTVVAQRGTGLGERLRNGFADLGPGVIIGMETPQAAHHLGTALDAIRRGRDVLGPATDGGYWMIGLCPSTVARVHEVFDDVPMSTPTTGALQLERLRAVGSDPPVVLPPARDLDTFDDLVAVARSGREGRLGPLARDVVRAVGADVTGGVRRATRSGRR